MEQQTKNVYQKLNACRLAFKNAKVAKSGKNTYAGYDYFELDDILNAIIPICNEHNCVTIVNFSQETAILTFHDCESGQDILFTSPMSTASLKGCHEVQNLGAVESYIKRYLYQNCFEIAEPDVCDRTMGKTEKQAQKPQKQAPQPKQAQQGEPDEATKAKNFENFVIKYCSADAKTCMAILQANGYSTPNEVPAEKRAEIAKEIKSKITIK